MRVGDSIHPSTVKRYQSIGRILVLHMSNNLITPPNQRGYTMPEVFVTTEWLSEHISDPNVRIVDTDVPELYETGHILGAINPIDHYYKTSLEDRTHIQGAEHFARTMSDMGIGDATTVVGYDR